jgi:hypothetical protein
MGFKKRVKKLFLPHRENNYQAKLLQPASLIVLLLIFMGAQLSLKFLALAKPGILGYSSQITPEKIISLTNDERINQGLKPLKTNDLLNQAAQQKAGDMFAFDYWAHQSPSGREPWSFLKAVGYNYRVAGENLARDFMRPEEVVRAWMASPTHKENIMNPKYREIGVAVVDGTLGGLKTTLVVQFFGTPAYLATNQTPQQPPAAAQAQQPAAQSAQQPTAEVNFETTETLAGTNENIKPIANPLQINKKLSGFIIGILTMVLVVDGYIVLKNKIYRSTGRTTAHISFLLFIGAIILLSTQPGLIG